MPERYRHLHHAERIQLIKKFVLGDSRGRTLFHEPGLKVTWHKIYGYANQKSKDTPHCKEMARELYSAIEKMLEKLEWIRDNAEDPDVAFAEICLALNLKESQLIDLLGLHPVDVEQDKWLLKQSIEWYLNYAINKSRTVLDSVSS